MPSSRSDLQIFPRQAGYRDGHAASSSAGTASHAAGGGFGFLSAGLASLPQDQRGHNSRHFVTLRGRRREFLLDNGKLRNAFPVAIGMPGWETPTGRFEVLQKIPNPVWVHPVSGERVEEQGPENPLGSHWIAFHRDCLGRDAHYGEAWITIKGCTTTGFHGTPHRWTVGRAVSHGCVRLYNEDVSALYRQVSLGTQVTVLP